MKSYSAAIVLAYNAIMRSAVFRTDGKPIDLSRALSLLARAVHTHETDESIWSSLGDGEECALGDLIVGAYWAMTDWHAGQSSPEYAALCALGRIYSPGYSSGPESDSGEVIAYELIDAYFAGKVRGNVATV